MNVRYLEKNDYSLIDLYAGNREKVLFRYFEPEPGLFVAEGPVVFELALRQGYEVFSVMCTRRMLDSPLLSKIQNAPVYVVDKEDAEEYLGYVFAGEISAVMRRKRSDDLSVSELKRVLVLENVENPTNIGAIFRTACALGMDAVLLSPGCSDPLYRRAIRVSTGNTLQMKWSYILESEEEWKEKGIELLKSWGFTTVGLALRDDNVSIEDPRLKTCDRLAVIMGNEGHGLYQSTIDACDYVARIEMREGVDSLNVGVAAGIAMYVLGKR